jgi:hypothetical protein
MTVLGLGHVYESLSRPKVGNGAITYIIPKARKHLNEIGSHLPTICADARQGRKWNVKGIVKDIKAQSSVGYGKH